MTKSDESGEQTPVAAPERVVQTLAEQRARHAVDRIGDMVIWIDPAGYIVDINRAAARRLGYPPDELQCAIWEIDDALTEESWSEVWDEWQRRGEFALRCSLRSKTGQLIAVEGTVHVVAELGGEAHACIMAREVTNQRRETITRELLTTAVEQSVESIIITDVEGRIEYVNPAFERVSGYRSEEVLGKSPRILKSGEHNPQLYADMWNTIKRGDTWTGHLINRRKDGTLYEEDARIEPVRSPSGEITHFVAVKRDVTDEYLLRKQLRHAQKMEAVAHMTCGIAHDFNNLLTGILACTEFVSRSLPDDAPQHDDLLRIQDCGRRASTLTRQLLGFSREQQLEPVVVDLADSLAEVGRLLRRVVSESIEIRILAKAGVARVKVDPARLQLALLNLALNARDAMPDGGLLTFELRETLDDPASGCVALVVHDTGVGMNDEVRRKAFDAFFTTKPEGAGTGLGLAVVREFVTESGGTISVASKPGRGATFEIQLPRVQDDARPGEARPSHDVPCEGTEGILVVDDDATVRRVIVRQLEVSGYRVVGAANAAEALSILGAHPRDFELLIVDVVLPGASGPDLARAALQTNPRLRIVFMSGYGSNARKQSASDIVPMARMQKPVERMGLLRAVRRVLDSEPDHTARPRTG